MALSTNLVSYWKFDESSGNAADSVGSNTLTNTNTVTYTTGKINNGANFVGASSQKFVHTGGIVSGATAMSISGWIKTSTAGVSIVSQYVSPVAGVWWLQLDASGHLVFFDYNGGSVFSTIDTVVLNDGIWHFFVFTINSALTSVNFSTDGSSFRTYSITSITNLGSQDFQIGYQNGGTYMNGMLDEIGVWNRALSADEASQLYNSGRGNSYPLTDTPSLYGGINYYKSDGNSTDSIGTNNGTDTNVTYTSGGNNGKINQGANFAGTGKIALSTTSSLTNTFTFTMWMNTTNVATRQGLFVKGDGASNATSSWSCEVGNTSGKITFTIMGGGTNASFTSATSVSANTWYFLAFVYDGTKTTLYINGSLDANSATQSWNINNITKGTTYGYFGDYTLLPYTGALDEMGIWSRALSGSEITTLYNGGAGLQYPFTGGGATLNTAFLAFM